MDHRGYAENAEKSMQLNELTEKVIGAAIEVHRHLGPGLLESAYRKCLSRELTQPSAVARIFLTRIASQQFSVAATRDARELVGWGARPRSNVPGAVP